MLVSTSLMQEEVLAIDSDSCPKPPQEHVSRGKE